MYQLYIANRNYSSWSLRPWVLLRELGIRFAEHSLIFGDEPAWTAFRRLSPSGKVPCLIDGDIVVWDSLAIVEHLYEAHPAVWPADRVARSWARSAAAEMHSGFSALRSRCSMNCGVRVRLHEYPSELAHDIARLSALWSDGLHRFGGPFLTGARFSAVDAFFAPVAFRIQTYGLELAPPAARYAEHLLTLASMRDWYAAGLAETTRDAPHEADMAAMGTIMQDLRAPP